MAAKYPRGTIINSGHRTLPICLSNLLIRCPHPLLLRRRRRRRLPRQQSMRPFIRILRLHCQRHHRLSRRGINRQRPPIRTHHRVSIILQVLVLANRVPRRRLPSCLRANTSLPSLINRVHRPQFLQHLTSTKSSTPLLSRLVHLLQEPLWHRPHHLSTYQHLLHLYPLKLVLC